MEEEITEFLENVFTFKMDVPLKRKFKEETQRVCRRFGRIQWKNDLLNRKLRIKILHW